MRNYVLILKNIIEKRIQKEGIRDLLLSIGKRRGSRANPTGGSENDYTTFGAHRGSRENSRERSRSRGRDGQDDSDPVTMYVVISELQSRIDAAAKEKHDFCTTLQQSEHVKAEVQSRLQLAENIIHELTQQKSELENGMVNLRKDKNELLDCIESQLHKVKSLEQRTEELHKALETQNGWKLRYHEAEHRAEALRCEV
jgi:chromosome segregation ATPase